VLGQSVDLIGSSPQLAALRREIQLAAGSQAKVLITGESGVGKELVAHLMHRYSARRQAPFLTVNCAGVPETLLESELFGYTKGSFTGAYRDKPGLLAALDGGTVLLDEVGEMGARMQALLLRFLETGELQPVGGTSVRRTDVRVIAATNRDLKAMVAASGFRADLYYRLNVVAVHVPPLRDHREDIPALVEHWLTAAAGESHAAAAQVSPSAMALMCQYSWPGNVRELRNVLERALVHATSSTIDVAELTAEVRGCLTDVPVPVGATLAPPRHVELVEAMTKRGQSFWDVVYEPFMRRDLTRDDLRRVIHDGLEQTRGSYKALVGLYNMDDSDYKRLLNFLRKHGCHMPFQTFRMARVKTDPADVAIPRSA
jgi:DNA-binding NtrC family response regulator